jgi:hypothetical protein
MVKSTFRLDFNLFLMLEPLVDGSVIDCLLRIAFKDELRMTKPRPIRNPAQLCSLFHIFCHEDEQLSHFFAFVADCFHVDTSSRCELMLTDFPTQLIQYLAPFRARTELTVGFQITLNFFINVCHYSLKSRDLLSFFQLFTALPESCRPLFTEDLLNGLGLVMDLVMDTPSAFFTLDSDSDNFQLPTIPADVLSDGFCFMLAIELLCCPIQRAIVFELPNESFLFGHTLPFHFPLRRWVCLIMSSHRRTISLIVNDEPVFEEAERLAFKSDMTLNTLGLHLHCNIASVELHRRPYDCVTDKTVFFKFDASTDAIWRDMVATVSGKTFSMSQPLFAQLEQPTINGAVDASALLIRSLLLLRGIFAHSESHQRDFCTTGGFPMMAALLSIGKPSRLRVYRPL